MPAHCKPEPNDVMAHGFGFVLMEMSDDDIHEIAARLVSEHENTDDDSDYMLAAFALHGFVVLRQMLKAVGEGKLMPVRR